MCEVFGYCGKEGYEINDYLKEFYSHSNAHPNGWGLACVDGNEAVIEKEPLQATKSNYLKERLTQSIISKNVLAHIRYATIGHVEYRNCHPYTKKDHQGRRWTEIHNGTIFDFPPLYKYVKLQKGDTDSERILLYLVDKINQAETNEKKLRGRERFTILDCIIGNMAKGNKLNIILFDGKYMYVHTNYKNSLYYLEKDRGIFFSTQPLSRENWKPVPFTRLMVYKEGKIIYEGKSHGNEYFDNEEDMKMIYQNYAEL